MTSGAERFINVEGVDGLIGAGVFLVISKGRVGRAG